MSLSPRLRKLSPPTTSTGTGESAAERSWRREPTTTISSTISSPCCANTGKAAGNASERATTGTTPRARRFRLLRLLFFQLCFIATPLKRLNAWVSSSTARIRQKRHRANPFRIDAEPPVGRRPGDADFKAAHYTPGEQCATAGVCDVIVRGVALIRFGGFAPVTPFGKARCLSMHRGLEASVARWDALIGGVFALPLTPHHSAQKRRTPATAPPNAGAHPRAEFAQQTPTRPAGARRRPRTSALRPRGCANPPRRRRSSLSCGRRIRPG